LELQAMRETDYYAALNAHYRPVRMLAWLVMALVAGAGVFAVLNTMYAAALGRVREFASLQTIGFLRSAVAVSLIQESALLSMAGSLLAASVAVFVLDGAAVRFTMGAFQLRVDGPAVLIGCATGLSLGVLGAIPPAVRAMWRPIAESLKAV
jgi:ABC-type antimicrobial peptide transport system permease subunit